MGRGSGEFGAKTAQKPSTKNILHCDTICGIMNRKKLKKLRQQLDSLRRSGGVKTRELEELAKALGRKRHKRGSEPTWVSELLKDSYPISIPSHTTDLNKFTARNILNQLESDLDELEEIYAHEEQEDPDDETIQQED